MVDLFWLHLALAFIVGSAWVTLTTIAAERFGSRVYSMGVRYFYPGLGLVPGTLAAYAAALISASSTALAIRKNLL